jgi:predicted XRE-type DNA-binding protein
MATKIERSSGDVFRDLGFSRPEAESLKLRAELMLQITRLIKKRKLTQAEAAKQLGVTQPRISDLVRGRIDLFSIDGLVEMLGRAGMRVRLHVAQSRRKHPVAA